MKSIAFITTLFSIILISISSVGCTPLPASSPQIQSQMRTEAVSLEPASGNFVAGTVLDIRANEFVVGRLDNSRTTLRMTDQSTIWDGIKWIGEMPIEKDDHLTASGGWDKDHLIFTVQNLYINIVNIKGVVKNADEKNTSLNMTDFRQGDKTVLVYPPTKIFQNGNTGASEYLANHMFPQSGAYVEVIGRQVKNGSVIVVNLYIQ